MKNDSMGTQSQSQYQYQYQYQNPNSSNKTINFAELMGLVQQPGKCISFPLFVVKLMFYLYDGKASDLTKMNMHTARLSCAMDGNMFESNAHILWNQMMENMKAHQQNFTMTHILNRVGLTAIKKSYDYNSYTGVVEPLLKYTSEATNPMFNTTNCDILKRMNDEISDTVIKTTPKLYQDEPNNVRELAHTANEYKKGVMQNVAGMNARIGWNAGKQTESTVLYMNVNAMSSGTVQNITKELMALKAGDKILISTSTGATDDRAKATQAGALAVKDAVISAATFMAKGLKDGYSKAAAAAVAVAAATSNSRLAISAGEVKAGLAGGIKAVMAWRKSRRGVINDDERPLLSVSEDDKNDDGKDVEESEGENVEEREGEDEHDKLLSRSSNPVSSRDSNETTIRSIFLRGYNTAVADYRNDGSAGEAIELDSLASAKAAATGPAETKTASTAAAGASEEASEEAAAGAAGTIASATEEETKAPGEAKFRLEQTQMWTVTGEPKTNAQYANVVNIPVSYFPLRYYNMMNTEPDNIANDTPLVVELQQFTQQV
jgi:hypothetical protein